MSRHRRSHQGFTLIELILVLSVITIISTIAIPNLLSSRINANEAAAIQTLRTVLSGQSSFQIRKVVDNDVPPDGEGEYGYLGELAGIVNLRGAVVALGPPTLGAKLGIVQNGAVTTNGYHYQLYLPGPGGIPVAEDPAGGKANIGELDADLAERFWVCYAWPAQINTSGNRVFVINQTGEILMSNNEGANQSYSGLVNAPAADAAFVNAGLITGRFARPNSNAVDGGVWRPVQ